MDASSTACLPPFVVVLVVVVVVVVRGTIVCGSVVGRLRTHCPPSSLAGAATDTSAQVRARPSGVAPRRTACTPNASSLVTLARSCPDRGSGSGSGSGSGVNFLRARSSDDTPAAAAAPTTAAAAAAALVARPRGVPSGVRSAAAGMVASAIGATGGSSLSTPLAERGAAPLGPCRRSAIAFQPRTRCCSDKAAAYISRLGFASGGATASV